MKKQVIINDGALSVSLQGILNTHVDSEKNSIEIHIYTNSEKIKRLKEKIECLELSIDGEKSTFKKALIIKTKDKERKKNDEKRFILIISLSADSIINEAKFLEKNFSHICAYEENRKTVSYWTEIEG